jgi:hypothetical protein
MPMPVKGLWQEHSPVHLQFLVMNNAPFSLSHSVGVKSAELCLKKNRIMQGWSELKAFTQE